MQLDDNPLGLWLLVVATVGAATISTLALLKYSHRSAASNGSTRVPGDDAAYLDLARSMKDKVVPPVQSHFRVFSILSYEDSNGEEQFVCGTNSEPAFIGGRQVLKV
jgi:hypothetical protein